MRQLLFILPLLFFGISNAQQPNKTEVPIIAMKLPIKTPVLIEGKTITFLEVLEDSRCPKGVECIWAGEVKILISIEEKGLPTEKKELIFGTSQPSEIETDLTLELPNYVLKFVGIQPYPQATESIKAEEYILLLSKQNFTEK